MPTGPAESSIRVVLDTNVLVAAAFRPRGAAANVVARARAGALTVIWNDATRRESERIVRRIPPIATSNVLGVFRLGDAFTGLLDEESFAFIVDRDDRKFAALACAAQATLLTQDAHLLSVGARIPCPVMSPNAFVALVGEERG